MTSLEEVSEIPQVRTRYGRLVKKPVKYEPVEIVEDDSEEEDISEDDDVSIDLNETDDETDDDDDDDEEADENGNLKGFVCSSEDEEDEEDIKLINEEND